MNTDKNEELQQMMMTPEEFINIQPMTESRYKIVFKSIFDVPAESLVNSINCDSVMGAGIALEFKKRYPKMFEDYKIKCKEGKIKPGDCYVYKDDNTEIYILGLAVKNSWKYWASKEWIEMCIKSLKLTLLENDIKSVNMPLIGGLNGKRGPYGKILGMTPPPERTELKALLERELKPFADKFCIDINLCIPDEAPKKVELTLDKFL